MLFMQSRRQNQLLLSAYCCELDEATSTKKCALGLECNICLHARVHKSLPRSSLYNHRLSRRLRTRDWL